MINKRTAGAVGFVLVIVLFILYAGVRFKNRVEASAQWPVVPGSILLSERAGGGAAQIQFEYAVGGQKYASSSVYFGFDPYRTAEDLLERYPQSEAVQVYYDPENPAIAVLEPGDEVMRRSIGYVKQNPQTFLVHIASLSMILVWIMYLIVNRGQKAY